MANNAVDLTEKLSLFSEHWSEPNEFSGALMRGSAAAAAAGSALTEPGPFEAY